MTDVERPDPLTPWTIGIGVSVPVVFVASLPVQRVVSDAAGVFVNVVGAAFLYAIVGATVMCALLAVTMLRRPRTRLAVALAAALGAAAGLAPLGLILFMRLSSHTCAVLNVLQLPWPEPWREIAHIGGGLIWLASTIGLIVAVTRPTFRRTGVALWIWSAVIAFPAFLLFFLIVFGDPAAGCVPV